MEIIGKVIEISVEEVPAGVGKQSGKKYEAFTARSVVFAGDKVTRFDRVSVAQKYGFDLYVVGKEYRVWIFPTVYIPTSEIQLRAVSLPVEVKPL